MWTNFCKHLVNILTRAVCQHFRIVDVSSFKEMIQRWYPRAKQAPKRENHLALDDIEDSIEELKFYRNHFFQKAEIPSND